MSLVINNKLIKTEDEIIELFGIKKSTMCQWYRKGLGKFTVNRINYIFEEDLEKYFKNLRNI